MDVKDFVNILGAEFFVGVPDSKLRPLVDYLMETYGNKGTSHIIAVNEGSAAALAAGYHLATGKTPVVYLQNSGLGNIVNPLLSLLHREVYGIPCVFVIGWRGEPGLHDEPQHLVQGRLTLPLLETMGVKTAVLTRDTTPADLTHMKEELAPHLAAGGQAALLVREGALSHAKQKYENPFPMRREEAIAEILDAVKDAVIVATTGKTGRELFELRAARGEGHAHDFLTVGSMGHASAIALGIALHRPDRRVVCIDGDGAALMHMGAMATIGAAAPENLVHVLLNNEAHESVGGAPTAAESVHFLHIADALGYRRILNADDTFSLRHALEQIKAHRELTFLEARVAIGSRADLGRPTTTPAENRDALMETLRK
ncbi:phosphonopyruvate decarboxylase [Selenomonas sp. F0473]|uniref:phosphonopyruvate decarboxylase n=1 Tax=Selenomonas sp. F0473 TaxID=999423 RepID=UPI00029E6B83|nr:phosphonopyruvate decarboxylase [Selenomonas sp. F0473]EKU71234.1 phosphonopyruvate decarboxylase [Selenomonas sp. F0473]